MIDKIILVLLAMGKMFLMFASELIVVIAIIGAVAAVRKSIKENTYNN